MKTQIKIADTPTLLRLAAEGRAAGYNRQLAEEFCTAVDPDGMHMVSFAMVHEHIAGEQAEPHMRCQMLAKAIDTMKPVTILIDMSMENYNALEVAQ